MTRLFRCQIELIYQDEHGERSVTSRIIVRHEPSEWPLVAYEFFRFVRCPL